MRKGKVSDIALKASITYLAIHLLGYLLTRLWGAFLILAAIATVGWMVPFAYFDWYCCGRGHEGTVWACAAICGSLTALGTISGMVTPAKKRRKRHS